MSWENCGICGKRKDFNDLGYHEGQLICNECGNKLIDEMEERTVKCRYLLTYIIIDRWEYGTNHNVKARVFSTRKEMIKCKNELLGKNGTREMYGGEYDDFEEHCLEEYLRDSSEMSVAYI